MFCLLCLLKLQKSAIYILIILWNRLNNKTFGVGAYHDGAMNGTAVHGTDGTAVREREYLYGRVPTSYPMVTLMFIIARIVFKNINFVYCPVNTLTRDSRITQF